MKKSLYTQVLIVCAVILLTCCEKSEKKCIVKGVLAEGETKSLNLIKSHKDPRSNKITVPIIDGAFTFEVDPSEMLAYSLYLDDAPYHPIIFFPDREEITMTIYPPEKQDENIIKGGVVNKQYQEYKKFEAELIAKFTNDTQAISDSIDVLQSKENYHTAAMTTLYEELKNAKSGEENNRIYAKINRLRTENQEFTEPAKLLNAKLLDAGRDFVNKKYHYLEQNLTIASYYILISDLLTYSEQLFDLNHIEQVQSKLTQQFKNHPYNKLAESILTGIKTIKIGSEYVDFSLPDIEGNQYTLSKLANGKYVLVDLWAPWCGPCIAKSRSMIPIYEEFHNKGFTVVGVAGQFDNIKAVKKRLEKDNYPWLTLVEYESNYSLWNTYGVRWSGGITLLLDPAGKIVLINPSADELRKVLKEVLI